MQHFGKYLGLLGLCASMGTVTALPPTVTPDYEIWISGSGIGSALLARQIPQYCLPGTLDVYSSAGQPGQTAAFCTLDDTLFAGGLNVLTPNVLIHLRTSPLLDAGARPVCDKASAGGGASPLDYMQVNANCALTAPNNYNCPATNVQQVEPDAGFSGVAPAELPATFSSTNCDAVTPWFGRVLRIVGNLRLRDALQTQQGLVVGANDVANQPSIPSGLVAGLLVGNVGNWSQVPCQGAGLDTCATGLTDSSVLVCRRVPTSVTQVQSNLIVLDNRCTPGALGPLPSPGNPFAGPDVVENASNQDLALCMTDAENNGRMAIGFETTVLAPGLTAAYRDLALDTVAPTVDNVLSGNYDKWSATTFQWRFPFVFAANQADITTVLEQIIVDAGSPAVLSAGGVGNGLFAFSKNGCQPGQPLCSLFNPGQTQSPNCTGPYFCP